VATSNLGQKNTCCCSTRSLIAVITKNVTGPYIEPLNPLHTYTARSFKIILLSPKKMNVFPLQIYSEL
jgi:hypothetical protein